MDALWNLEDKLKISTQRAIILLISVSIVAIIVLGATIIMILKNKAQRSNRIASCHEYSSDDEENESLISYERQHCCSRSWRVNSVIKKALRGSACWSKANKLDDHDINLVISKCNNGNLLPFSCCGRTVGKKKLPVWQRPILMGEKCELPRFSGLILYDERGRPLPHFHHQYDPHSSSTASSSYYQVEVSRTNMLKDLLCFSSRSDNSSNYMIS